MNLQLPEIPTKGYTSPLQIARVLTEAWAKTNLYCVACENDYLQQTINNHKATDFLCNACGEAYELKSGKSLPTNRIVDAGYDSMISAIRGDRAPNLFFLHYSLSAGVQNLVLIPRYFFTELCIEKRKPLAPTARRAGWIGCNIRLDLIAPEGRIIVVSHQAIAPSESVRAAYDRFMPLRTIPPNIRGWTLAVLLNIHRIGKPHFALNDIYAFETALAQQFPSNRNIRPKIRQQLQVLRDLGVLQFVNHGQYLLL